MATFALYTLGSVALSYAAGQLLAPESDSPVQDFKPTPTVERGSPVPLVLSARDDIAPMMFWAGNRSVKNEEVDGGKGLFSGSSPEQKVYFENAFHGICVGPGRRLWAIKLNGKVIYKGPIDPVSHPSGTLVDLGDKGSFKIYWGEDHQPVNTFLGDASRVGVTSRWPFVMYIEWRAFRLGTSPVWGRLKYEVEVWPHNPKLCGSPLYLKPTRSLVGTADNIDVITNGAQGTNFVEIFSGSNKFKASQFCRVEGQTIPDGNYIIEKVEKFKTVTGLKKRRIFLGVPLIIAPFLTASQGTIQAYQQDSNDGLNAAHIIHQVLFNPAPHGMGISEEGYDIPSLEALGALVTTEGLRSSLVANQFKSGASVIGDMMLDIGFMMPHNPSTGLIEFRSIREGGTIAALTADVLTGDPPEVDTIQISDEPASRKLFEFRDRSRAYSLMPITIDDDGQATVDMAFGQEKIRMPTVRDFDTGSLIAVRRSQETYSHDQKLRVRANREAALIIPGQLFSVPGISSALICLESERRDSLSGEFDLTAEPNYYGLPATILDTFDGGEPFPVSEDPDEVDEVIPFEIPTQLTVDGQIRFGVARLRTDTTVASSLIHLSPDDTTFALLGEESGTHTGGTLDGAWDAGPGFVDIGPTITVGGPDISSALDLSAAADELNWQKGRQIAIVGTGEDSEIWFVRYVEALGGDSYRLREVLTARFDTDRLSHVAGTAVILMDEAQLKQFTDLSLVPVETFYVKSQPNGQDSAALDEVSSEQFDVYGKGLRPLPARGLRAGGPDCPTGGGFLLGEDITARWNYRPSPGASAASSGAGNFGAGDALLSMPEFDGICRLKIYESFSTLRRTVEGTLADFTLPDGTIGYAYDWADAAADASISPGYTGSFLLSFEIAFLKGTLESSLTTVDTQAEGGTAP